MAGQTPPDKTHNTDKTQSPAKEPVKKGVLSDLSVLSDRGEAFDPEARAAIIRALGAGLATPGAIATAARLGATATYRELDRMAAAGIVGRGKCGALHLKKSDDTEARCAPDP